MRRKIIISLILSALCFYLSGGIALCLGSQVQIKAKVNKKIVLIGERFKYQVSVSSPANIEIKMPVVTDTIGDFTIQKASVRKNKAAYVLNSFNVGTTQIPPTVISYRNKGAEKWSTASSNPVAIEVKDIIIENAYEIKGLKGALGFLYRYRHIVTIAVSAVFLLVLFFIFVITQKLIGKKKEPVIYPDETALKQLNSLKGLNTDFIQMTDILRWYVEKRYSINASKMTTLQFNEKIMQLGEISSDNKTRMLELLKRKDDIQFAQGAISEAELSQTAAFIKKFIENTKENR